MWLGIDDSKQALTIQAFSGIALSSLVEVIMQCIERLNN